ncbi:phosphate ABC transporter permease [Natronococcus jeotgali]|nr:phosphate ABC transporter permease [Natronococcus jeotgali]
MIDGVAAAFVLAGVALLLSGTALSVYGIVAVGLAAGAGAGSLVGPALGLEAVGPGVAAAVGAVVGGLGSYLLVSVAVSLLGFAVGAPLALAALSSSSAAAGWLPEWGGAVAVGLVAAVLALVLTRWVIAAITAVVGAALASRALTPEGLLAARESLTLEPLLFDVGSPTFLALVAIGFLSQFGFLSLGTLPRLLFPRRREDSRATR